MRLDAPAPVSKETSEGWAAAGCVDAMFVWAWVPLFSDHHIWGLPGKAFISLNGIRERKQKKKCF